MVHKSLNDPHSKTQWFKTTLYNISHFCACLCSCAALTKSCRLGGLNKKLLLLTVLEAGKSQNKVPQIRCLVRVCLLDVPSHGRKRVKEFSGVSCKRALILFMRTPHSSINHLSKASPLNIIISEVRFQQRNFRGAQTFSP